MQRKLTSKEVFASYLECQNLVNKGVISPNWSDDGSRFWYLGGTPNDREFYQVDLDSGKTQVIFDVERLRQVMAAEVGCESNCNGVPFETFEMLGDEEIQFEYNGQFWILDVSEYTLQKRMEADNIESPSSDGVQLNTWLRQGNIFHHQIPTSEQPSPDGCWLASIKNNNVVLRSTMDERYQSMTDCGTDSNFWDLDVINFPLPKNSIFYSTPVLSWSPDSLTLLTYKRDITGVFQHPRVHWLKPFEEVEYIPWTRAGARMERIQPVFIDVRSGCQIPVELDQLEDRYIHLLGWLPCGSEVLLIVYDRYFKSVEIVAANVMTGATRPIMQETSDTFVKIQHDAIIFGSHGFKILPDSSGFLWLSTMDGHNHIYHYDLSGNLVSQLTKGDWPVHGGMEILADGFVYFVAAIDIDRPYDAHICRVLLSGGQIEQLTTSQGIHRPIFSPNNKMHTFIDIHSAIDRPVQTDLVKTDGTYLTTLEKMEFSLLSEIGYVPAEEYIVKAADGETDLWGVMYKPYDFDPKERYPVIEYIYGGPQINSVERSFSLNESTHFGKIPRALAQLGYIVVCLDARGTPNRSKAFQDVVYQAWEVNVIPDHAAGISQLCERHSWMDVNRVGITGHSWGGYYSTLALIQAPNVYSTAVSSSPGAYDLWGYAIHEPYLGSPKENRAPYDNASLIARAGEVKGNLMIVAATSDHIVSPIKMTHALMQAGIDHEFVLLPDTPHAYSGKAEDYFMMKLTGWFKRHLQQEND